MTNKYELAVYFAAKEIKRKRDVIRRQRIVIVVLTVCFLLVAWKGLL